MQERVARFDAFKLSASQGALHGTVMPSSLERLGERVAGGDGEVHWTIRGGKDPQGRPAISVVLDGSVPLVCQRCLGVLRHEVGQTTTLLLARSDAELEKLDEASEHEVVLANAPLETLALVEDELLLTLPFAPRHEVQCGAGTGAGSSRAPR